MYAVVEIQGSQFKVSKDQKLYVNRIDAKEGSKVSFDNVLLIDDGKKVQVGKPSLSGTSVEAKVISHLKDDKVIVFKKKRRKGYKVKNGHRQPITEIIIQGISEKKAAPKKETTAAKKTTAVKKTTAAKKTTAVKKTTAAK
ncbi:MAG: 50S ribosomal protein L21, partial [Candidatus Neomarinimicrobiota bacterium]